MRFCETSRELRRSNVHFLHYGKTMLESWMFSSGKKKLQREEYAGVEEIFVLEQRYIVDAKVLKREG